MIELPKPDTAGRNFLLRSFFGAAKRLSRPGTNIQRDSRLRVLSFRWHPSHQYEITRLPFDFTFATGFDDLITESWAYSMRPLRKNIRFCHRSKINPRDYDVCIVSFDENVLCPELSNGILPANWGEPFAWALSIDNLPKIAICHGTPPFRGQYAANKERIIAFEVLDEQRLKLVDSLRAANTFVVCNSWQAKTEWGFDNCRVIWHGFDPDEFRMGSHTRDVLTLRHDRTRPHYRGMFEQAEIERQLNPDIEVVCGGPDELPIKARNANAFAMRKFQFYVDHIGQFKIYLNATLRSPMPRSRGEAMMTGTIPITLANHDVEMFIENGVDGFYSDNPEDLACFINDNIHDERRITRMGTAARKKAIDLFHCQRFLDDWWKLLEDRLGRKLRHD